MMTNKEILTVVTAAENGVEIEAQDIDGNFYLIENPRWNFSKLMYRVKSPAKQIVKSLAWRRSDTGQVYWTNEPQLASVWQRFPCADFEGEVES